MADKSRTPLRKKERKEMESTEMNKDVKEVKNERESEVYNEEDPSTEAVTSGAAASSQNGDFHVEPMELPPFEIIAGDRIDPFAFKFQFKNVEYSSGRNKTFLCYLVDKGNTVDGLLRGYLEDEHTGPHAEEAFFIQCLPQYDPAFKYTITWNPVGNM